MNVAAFCAGLLIGMALVIGGLLLWLRAEPLDQISDDRPYGDWPACPRGCGCSGSVHSGGE